MLHVWGEGTLQSESSKCLYCFVQERIAVFNIIDTEIAGLSFRAFQIGSYYVVMFHESSKVTW